MQLIYHIFIINSAVILFIMFRSKSHSQCSDDKTFNFNYEIDIEKRRNGQTFNKQEGFDFGDFPDLREDRSQKSYMTSQKKWLPSELGKKQDDDSFHLTDNGTQLSILKKQASYVDDVPRIIMQENSVKYSKPARFSNLHSSFKTISNNTDRRPHNKDPLSPELQKPKNPLQQQGDNHLIKAKIHKTTPITPRGYQQKQQYGPGEGLFGKQAGVNFKVTKQWSLEQQIENLTSKIQFYENNDSLLDHQYFKVQDQIQKLTAELQNPINNIEVTRYADETNHINIKIAEQRNLERSLTQTQQKLEEEFLQISTSIESLKFDRPAIVKDEAKAIIDEINNLKRQFFSYKRDEGSLNLSSTIQQPIVSIQNRMLTPEPFRRTTPEQVLFSQFLDEIKEAERKMNYPNYIYNIKMCLIKNVWNIYQNADLCINVSSRNYPKFEIKVGNKCIKDLQNFYFKQNANRVAENQKLFGQSLYTHSFTINQLSQPFTKIEIKYNSPLKSLGQQQIILYIPTLPLHYGEFIPIYSKQFDIEKQLHSNTLEQIKSQEYKQIDNQIFTQGSIKQSTFFYPNLLYHSTKERNGTNIEVIRGIFQTFSTMEGALVQIKQRRNLVSVSIRNNIPFLLDSLEFLFTIV